MSSPFSVASSAGGSPNYQSYNPFPAFHNNYIQAMAGPPYGQQQQIQQFYQPPPGQNDLEVLERLKDTIKNNQHEFFRPIPQPAALASIYLGPHTSVPPHPDQVPGDRQLGQNEYEPSRDVASGAGNNGVSQARGRRGSDVWEGSRRPAAYPASGTQGPNTNNVPPAGGPGSQRYDEKAMDVDHSGPPGLGPSSVPPRRDYHNGRSDKNAAGESASGGGNTLPSKVPGFDGKEDPRSSRDRDSVFGNRYATASMDDIKPSIRNDRDRRPGSPERLGPDSGRGRFYDRDRDRDRDNRERERDKEGGPTWDRDRERDRDRNDRRPFDNRYGGGGRDFDRDRRNDDRFNRFSDNRRSFENRYTGNSNVDAGLKRYDTKSSVNEPAPATNSPANPPTSRIDDRDIRDRERSGPPESRPPRPLTEERSFGRYDDRRPPPPLEDRRPPPPDDRAPRPGGPPDDRRGPLPALSDRDRSVRGDDRRPLPPPSSIPINDRSVRPPIEDRDRRPPLDSAVGDRQVRPLVDDRRPAPLSRPSSPIPSSAPGLTSRAGPPDDRRPPPPRAVDDRRPPPSGPPPLRSGPSDDHRPPGLSSPSIPVNTPGERERIRSGAGDDTTRAPPTVDSASSRPSLADRDRDRASISRSLPQDDRARDARSQIPLEERISRPQPTLQERLSRPEKSPATFTRSEERPIRPPATTEDRPSAAAPAPVSRDDSRTTIRPPPAASATTSKPDVRQPVPGGPDVSSRPADARGGVSTTASINTPPEGARLPTQTTVPDDRGRPLNNDRFRQTSGPSAADRERINSGPPPPRANYTGGNAPTRAPDDRTFKPRSSTVSPSRRPDFRPGYRPSQDYDRDRRPESATAMDVDPPPSSRFPPPSSTADRQPPPAPYRRPSPASFNRERNWAPADAYSGDAARRPPPDSHGGATFTREWREDERGGYPEDWDRRGQWDRERERDRDSARDRDFDRDRFIERDAVAGSAPAWETREERERRVSYGGPADPLPASTPAPAPRTYESRPLSSRLTDGYPPAGDDRDRDRDRDRTYGRDYERARYPPLDADAPAPYSRIRPRSPSPPATSLRRPVDDMRPPPLKRARDDGYVAGAYFSPPPPPGMEPPADYGHSHLASRMRTPPPGAGAYYDDVRTSGYTTSPGGGAPRDREFVDDGYGTYDRRAVDARMPPPRSPPPYSRPAPYARDDRRYMPPPSRP